MVVLALHRDLWVAYDAEGCRLDKAWRGGVTLDGSVYTGAHGPNPSMAGTVLVRGEASPFVLIAGGERTAVVPVWRGYRVEDGRAILMGEFEVGGRTVRIEESPEAAMHEGVFSLERRFTVEGLPAGATLGVVVPSRDAVGKSLRVCVENGAVIDDLVAVVHGGTTVVTLELPTEEAGR
jgi:cytochrome c